VNYILERLNEHLSLNDTDNDKITKRVEELREKRKQAMMATYSDDEELRRLQVQLKSMGLTMAIPSDNGIEDDDSQAQKVNNLVNEADVNISIHRNNIDEQNNYYIGDYQGENPEENEVEE
jgi:predicted sulfurtransferase